jgi:hypothetical protein
MYSAFPGDADMQQLTFDIPPAQSATSTTAAPAADDHGIPLIGRARTIFEAMKAIVEAPGCRLKHYTVDFYKYDRQYLANTRAIGRYVWILRDSGTHLIRVGVHARACTEIDAAFSCGSDAFDVYLIDMDRVSIQPITEARARGLGNQLQYVTKDGTVSKAGLALAWMRVDFTPWSDGRAPQGIVKITRVAQNLSKGDLIALVQIAQCEVIERSQSLFTGMALCTLDGSEIFDLIENAA